MPCIVTSYNLGRKSALSMYDGRSRGGRSRRKRPLVGGVVSMSRTASGKIDRRLKSYWRRERDWCLSVVVDGLLTGSKMS